MGSVCVLHCHMTDTLGIDYLCCLVSGVDGLKFHLTACFCKTDLGFIWSTVMRLTNLWVSYFKISHQTTVTATITSLYTFPLQVYYCNCVCFVLSCTQCTIFESFSYCCLEFPFVEGVQYINFSLILLKFLNNFFL